MREFTSGFLRFTHHIKNMRSQLKIFINNTSFSASWIQCYSPRYSPSQLNSGHRVPSENADFIWCVVVVPTVFFWAPTMKWGITAANVNDFSRPVEAISYPQQMGKDPRLELGSCIGTSLVVR
jgi:hypothetical protein